MLQLRIGFGVEACVSDALQSHISEWDVAEVEIHTRAEKAAAQLSELSQHIGTIARCLMLFALFMHLSGRGCVLDDASEAVTLVDASGRCRYVTTTRHCL